MEMEALVDWTELPPELIETISENLTIYCDYLRFQAVCRCFRSSVPKTPSRLPPQLPWLMLPQSQQSHHSRRAFFDLSANRVRFLHLPEASDHGKRRCGSSHGWLVILDETPNVLLLNPLTRAKIYLPPLFTFPNVVSFNYFEIGREYTLSFWRGSGGGRFNRNLRQMRDSFIKKIVLSSSPGKGSDFIAVAILNQTGDLAYCRNGDQGWSIIEGTKSYCEDVIYNKGLFYAVDKGGAVAVCDVGAGDSATVSIIRTPPQLGGDMQYLVSSGDELLLVTRFLGLEFGFEPDHPQLIYRTIRFEVFRLNWSGPQWERVRSLGDKVLFIGENSSLSLSASDFPGCGRDSIYYTDDYSEGNFDDVLGQHDSGIFSLCSGSIEPLPCYPRNLHYRLRWPPPLWVSPNPC
ncbi:hypothetical protein ACOSP7_011226 [Xanthoceras sorbifolium]|uniref:KIB1-4 beta-propeller domain-containing protein n=1 Tax=Xanthoceras sorbifolium TaxID=99658 RepID=A0ABQ8H017_9ROSI|nr:hypothetical protein JRO89_XSUnG0038700 [Xanthoceras sorbifolium]